jgi:DNA-directed RNA polymerase subunit alpha
MEMIRKLQMPIADLDLSVRAGNCLESAQIRTVGELVQKSEDELLTLRAFGRTSLREIEKKLEELDLALGMPVPEAFRIN